MYTGSIFPVEVPRVTLPYGATTKPYAPQRPHQGVDLAPWPGSHGRPVLAAWGGVVTKAGDSGKGYGNWVVMECSLPFSVRARGLNGTELLDAGETFHVIYAHLAWVDAEEGQRLPAGATLGTIGNTGRSSGPHLHLEVRTGDYGAYNTVNPLDVLAACTRGLEPFVGEPLGAGAPERTPQRLGSFDTLVLEGFDPLELLAGALRVLCGKDKRVVVRRAFLASLTERSDGTRKLDARAVG